MKIKNIYILSVSVIGVIIFFEFWAYKFEKKYKADMHNHPKVYCYDITRGTPNACIVITDLKYKDSLINYYRLWLRGANPYFNFPLNQIRTDIPVYQIGYVGNDSLIVKVYVDYNETIVYVYKYLLHNAPPPQLHTKKGRIPE